MKLRPASAPRNTTNGDRHGLAPTNQNDQSFAASDTRVEQLRCSMGIMLPHYRYRFCDCASRTGLRRRPDVARDIMETGPKPTARRQSPASRACWCAHPALAVSPRPTFAGPHPVHHRRGGYDGNTGWPSVRPKLQALLTETAKAVFGQWVEIRPNCQRLHAWGVPEGA